MLPQRPLCLFVGQLCQAVDLLRLPIRRTAATGLPRTRPITRTPSARPICITDMLGIIRRVARLVHRELETTGEVLVPDTI
jgi:hypothetical protein